MLTPLGAVIVVGAEVPVGAFMSFGWGAPPVLRDEYGGVIVLELASIDVASGEFEDEYGGVSVALDVVSSLANALLDWLAANEPTTAKDTFPATAGLPSAFEYAFISLLHFMSCILD